MKIRRLHPEAKLRLHQPNGVTAKSQTYCLTNLVKVRGPVKLWFLEACEFFFGAQLRRQAQRIRAEKRVLLTRQEPGYDHVDAFRCTPPLTKLYNRPRRI